MSCSECRGYGVAYCPCCGKGRSNEECLEDRIDFDPIVNSILESLKSDPNILLDDVVDAIGNWAKKYAQSFDDECLICDHALNKRLVDEPIFQNYHFSDA